jgi:hypothetical protein
LPSLSRSEVDRAGERIRADVRSGVTPREADLEIVEQYRAEFIPLTLAMHDQLRALEAHLRERFEQSGVDVGAASPLVSSFILSAAARPKTAAAIVAKLVRGRTRLSQMQDIAGGRIVVPLPGIQDTFRDGLLEAHRQLAAAEAHVTDTRAEGDALGYRGLHVVLRAVRYPVEIQIRTPAEQLWAQVVEGVDRRFGWDLKHGNGPPEWRQWLYDLSQELARLQAGEQPNLPDPPEPFDLKDV